MQETNAHPNGSSGHSAALQERIAQSIAEAGGWLGFDRFMALALYAPGLGYYAGTRPKFGAMPSSAGTCSTSCHL